MEAGIPLYWCSGVVASFLLVLAYCFLEHSGIFLGLFEMLVLPTIKTDITYSHWFNVFRSLYSSIGYSLGMLI